MNRHNEENMRGLCEAWRQSDLSQKAFAIDHGIRPATFYYWLRKLNESSVATSSHKGFQSIAMDLPMQSVLAVVRYPSGVSVEWHGSADTIHLLKSLL
jgi:transposase-like protein